MSTREVILDGGSPWGFRMHGGADVGQPLRISRVNPGSKAAQKGVREGDIISSINGQSARSVTNSDAHALLRNAGHTLQLGLNQECGGSPKRRIYRNVQQDSRTETIKRSCTSTSSSSTVKISTGTNGSPSGAEGKKETSAPIQNGVNKSTSSSIEIKNNNNNSKGRRRRRQHSDKREELNTIVEQSQEDSNMSGENLLQTDVNISQTAAPGDKSLGTKGSTSVGGEEAVVGSRSRGRRLRKSRANRRKCRESGDFGKVSGQDDTKVTVMGAIGGEVAAVVELKGNLVTLKKDQVTEKVGEQNSEKVVAGEMFVEEDVSAEDITKDRVSVSVEARNPSIDVNTICDKSVKDNNSTVSAALSSQDVMDLEPVIFSESKNVTSKTSIKLNYDTRGNLEEDLLEKQLQKQDSDLDFSQNEVVLSSDNYMYSKNNDGQKNSALIDCDKIKDISESCFGKRVDFLIHEEMTPSSETQQVPDILENNDLLASVCDCTVKNNEGLPKKPQPRQDNKTISRSSFQETDLIKCNEKKDKDSIAMNKKKFSSSGDRDNDSELMENYKETLIPEDIPILLENKEDFAKEESKEEKGDIIKIDNWSDSISKEVEKENLLETKEQLSDVHDKGNEIIPSTFEQNKKSIGSKEDNPPAIKSGVSLASSTSTEERTKINTNEHSEQIRLSGLNESQGEINVITVEETFHTSREREGDGTVRTTSSGTDIVSGRAPVDCEVEEGNRSVNISPLIENDIIGGCLKTSNVEYPIIETATTEMDDVLSNAKSVEGVQYTVDIRYCQGIVDQIITNSTILAEKETRETTSNVSQEILSTSTSTVLKVPACLENQISLNEEINDHLKNGLESLHILENEISKREEPTPESCTQLKDPTVGKNESDSIDIVDCISSSNVTVLCETLDKIHNVSPNSVKGDSQLFQGETIPSERDSDHTSFYKAQISDADHTQHLTEHKALEISENKEEEDWQVLGESDFSDLPQNYSNAKPQLQEEISAHIVLTENAAESNKDLKLCDGVLSSEDQELLEPFPPMPADEEENLRRFLQTLNLENYSDVPQENRTTSLEYKTVPEDPVLTKRGKNRHALETYFMPCQNPRFLGVILEESNENNEGDKLDENMYEEEINEYPDKEHDEADDTKVEHSGWEDVIFDPVTNDVVVISRGKKCTVQENTPQRTIFVEYTEKKSWSHNRFDVWGGDGSFYPEEPENAVISEVVLEDTEDKERDTPWERSNGKVWDDAVYFPEVQEVRGPEEDDVRVKVELAESSDEGEVTYTRGETRTREHEVEIVFLEDTSSASSVIVTVDDPGDDADIEEEELEDTIDPMNVVSVIKRCQNQSSTDEDLQLNNDFDEKDTILDGTENVSCGLKTNQNEMISTFDVDLTNPKEQIFENESYHLNIEQLQGTNNKAISKEETGNVLNYDNTSIEEIKCTTNLGSSIDKESTSMKVLNVETNYVENSPLDISNNIASISSIPTKHDLQTNLTHEDQQATQDNNKHNTKIVDFFKRLFVILPKADNNNKNLHDVLEELIRDPTSPLSPTTRGNITVLLSDNATRNISDSSETPPQDTNSATKMEQPETVHDITETHCQESSVGQHNQGYITPSEKSPDEGNTSQKEENPKETENLTELTSPISHSRQNSSSSEACSHSTTVFNPSKSPWSSERDITDLETDNRAQEGQEYDPTTDPPEISLKNVHVKPLKELALSKVVSLPYGVDILVCLGISEIRHLNTHLLTKTSNISVTKVGNTSDEIEEKINNNNNNNNCTIQSNEELGKKPNTQLSGEPSNSDTSCVDVKSQEYPENGEGNKHSPSPPPVPPPPHISRVIDKDWIGMPTRVDPRLLVCLSPSQRRGFQGQYVVPTPDEAESLLDLHRKFVERRGYHEGAPTPPPNRHKSTHSISLIREQLASSSCSLNVTKVRDKMSQNKESLDLENGEIINNNPHSKQSIPSEHPSENSNLIYNVTNLSSNSRYQDKKLNPFKNINQSTQPSIVPPISNTCDEDTISIRAEEEEHKKRQVSHPCENSSQQKEFKSTDVTSPQVKIHTAEEEEERMREEHAGESETERSRLLAIIRDAASHRVEERRTPPESKPENRTHILNRQETHRSREDDGLSKTIDGMLSLSDVFRNQENVYSPHQQKKYAESIDNDQYDYRISNRRSWAPAGTQLSSGDSYQQKENKQTAFQTETNRRASTICSGPYYDSHEQDFEILYQGISPVSSPLPGETGNKERLKVKLLSEWLTIARGNEASRNVSEEDRHIFFVGSHSAQKSRKRSDETVNVGSRPRSQTSESLQTSSEVQQKNSSSKQTNEQLLGKIQTRESTPCRKEKEREGTSDDIDQHNSPKVSQTNTSEDHQKLKELIVQRRYSLPKNVDGNKEEQETQIQQEKTEQDRSKPVQRKRFSLPPEREQQTEKEAKLSQERRHNVYFELPSIPDVSVNQHDYNNYYNLQYRRFSDPKPISETNPNYEAHAGRRFDADKYIISKKGDIAIIQSEVVTRKPPCRSEKPLLQRPNSMPGTFATGGEIFRQQMYLEYMSKVAERAERRKQKVIRISGPPGGDDHQPLSPETEFGPCDSQENLTPSSVITAQQLEDEFMGRVRERMDKLGINYDEEENADDGRLEVSSSKTVHEDKSVLQECRGGPRRMLPADDGSSWKAQLPKHLQEFLILSAAATASDDVTSDTEGVWSPSQRQTATTPGEPTPNEEDKREDGVTIPVWTPKSSPLAERKEFRPVSFESPTLPRKNRSASATNIAPFAPEEIKQSPPSSKTQGTTPVKPLWQQDNDISLQSPLSEKSAASSTLTSTFERRLVQSQSAPASGLSSLASSGVKLPRAQNPTITLLQKAREGQLPRGAHYLDHKMNSSDGNKGYNNPNEILYTVSKEYEAERDGDSRKKVVDPTPRKYEGIGPTTRDGIPIVLRSEIKDMNQAKWYKRMYDSLHRAGTDGDYVTIRYKPRKGHYPYTSAGGYLSEPDHHGYDSDIGFAAKYATLDRRRIKNKENDFTTNTLPRSKYVPHPNSIKHATEVYKNQPGRIEDYMPGRSSISEKETKQWWDEVLDIFDGWLDTNSSHPNYRSIFSDYDIYHRQEANERRTTPSTPSGKSFMTHALKESGYESDSTLVFKRRDENLQNQLSPAQHKIAYNTIQKGGEVPLHGLRKPAPERPKESPHRYVESEVTIHYRSPVRSEAKEVFSEEELARRQAEAMRRIYQEERRRKYLQELQDMNSRRHTDNFTPSQKSPISLNRYDDFLDDISKSKGREQTPEPKLVARALYNFAGQTSRELSFRRGDIIFVRRQIDKNWYEGEHNAMIGLFPFNYIEIIPYDGIRTMPKRPSEGQARAKFNFIAQTHLELSLIKGEMVVLTRRVDDNWFEGRIGAKKGIFPVSYVEVLQEPGERPLTPSTPVNKPVTSPASHSVLVNGSSGSKQPKYPHTSSYYKTSSPGHYATLPRQSHQPTSTLPAVNQTLHIDTHSDPVPYRALYNYRPQNDDELELVEGDTVYVMEKCDDGWYIGSSERSGYFGTFPGNYVERI